MVADSDDEGSLAGPVQHEGGAVSSGTDTREQREIGLKPDARGPVSVTVGVAPKQLLHQHEGGAVSSGADTREQREIGLSPSARGPVSVAVGYQDAACLGKKKNKDVGCQHNPVFRQATGIKIGAICRCKVRCQ